jgi:hypothetical protein
LPCEAREDFREAGMGFNMGRFFGRGKARARADGPGKGPVRFPRKG